MRVLLSLSFCLVSFITACGQDTAGAYMNTIPGIYVQQDGGLYSTNYTIKYNGRYKEELRRFEHGSRVTGRGNWIAGKDRIVLTRKVLLIFKGKETVLYITPDGRLKYVSDTNCDHYFKKVGSGG